MDRMLIYGLILSLSWAAQAQVCAPNPAPIQVFRSHFEAGQSEALARQPDLQFGAPTLSEGVVPLKLNSAHRLQKMMGFGGAMTESCAINMMKLDADRRAQALDSLFSRFTGAGFDYVRLPIGASDFADPVQGPYTYDDSVEPDPKLLHFDLSRDQKSFDLLGAAQHINPDLKIMISPWTAPAWMKTSHNLRGGGTGPRALCRLCPLFSTSHSGAARPWLTYRHHEHSKRTGLVNRRLPEYGNDPLRTARLYPQLLSS